MAQEEQISCPFVLPRCRLFDSKGRYSSSPSMIWLLKLPGYLDMVNQSLLVQHDMGVSEEDAKKILRNGGILNEATDEYLIQIYFATPSDYFVLICFFQSCPSSSWLFLISVQYISHFRIAVPTSAQLSRFVIMSTSDPNWSSIRPRPEAVGPLARGGDPQQYASISPANHIYFLHPHYRPPTNVILVLLAPDGPEGGLEYGFAHSACAVVAGNRWDGVFTRLDGAPLDFAPGNIMPRGKYFFQIEGSTLERPYPIVPSFREWSFPHEKLPSFWQFNRPPASGPSHASSDFSHAVSSQNLTCRMSDHIEGTEASHLCPRSEVEWFKHNHMLRHNSRSDLSVGKVIDDTANAVLLRGDLHALYDAHSFVFVPKIGEVYTGEATRIVTHLLVPSPELGLPSSLRGLRWQFSDIYDNSGPEESIEMSYLQTGQLGLSRELTVKTYRDKLLPKGQQRNQEQSKPCLMTMMTAMAFQTANSGKAVNGRGMVSPL